MSRTSLTDPLLINDLACSNGFIGITFCPGKKGSSLTGPSWNRDLALDLDRVANWRPNLVVTLMEDHELAHMGVPNLGTAVEARGLTWLHLPIKDMSIPGAAFERRWVYFGQMIRECLASGGRVLIHCRGGLGRAGTIAARLLIEFGEAPKVAIQKVRLARPKAIETAKQAAFLLTVTPQKFAGPNHVNKINPPPRHVSLKPTDNPVLRKCVRIIAMVHELHKAGYQHIRMVPMIAPSGLYWRCAITYSGNVEDDGYTIRNWDTDLGLVAVYTSGQGAGYFGWKNVEHLSARQMAEKFISDFPLIARNGTGRDWMNAGWVTDVLGAAEQDGTDALVYLQADWDIDPEYLQCWSPPPPVR